MPVRGRSSSTGGTVKLRWLPWLAVSASPPVETSDGAQVPDLSVDELTRHAWLDRDLSWLEFNRRVLNEALDERNRLLERVKFLAIFSSNLDEFFMKRIALIRPQSGDSSLAAQDRRESLTRNREVIASMLAEQAACYSDVIKPQLAEHGIQLVDWGELSEAQCEEVSIAVRHARSRRS